MIKGFQNNSLDDSGHIFELKLNEWYIFLHPCILSSISSTPLKLNGGVQDHRLGHWYSFQFPTKIYIREINFQSFVSFRPSPSAHKFEGNRVLPHLSYIFGTSIRPGEGGARESRDPDLWKDLCWWMCSRCLERHPSHFHILRWMTFLRWIINN